MLFSDRPRQHYARSALREVICQLRFPTILSIAANEPAAFQEAIRHARSEEHTSELQSHLT